MFQLTGGCAEGHRGDEWRDHRVEAAVRGPGPAQGGPARPPRLAVHAAHDQHAASTTTGMGTNEGNILFNGALNTFYLRLYGIKHMVKDHSDSERGNPLPPHGLLFPISSKGYFICTIPHTG